MLEQLPKMLLMMLERLSEEQTLLTWNVNGHEHLTTLTIRFSEGGHITNTSTPGSRYGSSLRGKSPSQLRRDNWRKSNRSKMYMDLPGKENNKIVMENNDGEFSPVLGDLSVPAMGGSMDAPNSPDLCKSDHVGHHQTVSDADQNKTMPCEQAANITPELKSLTLSASFGDNDSVKESDDDSETNQDSVHDKVDENYMIGPVNPFIHFSKVTADFRSELEFMTMRGLTYTGEIVCFERNNLKEPFYVLYEFDENDLYNDDYGDAMHWMSKFYDQRIMNSWVQETRALCICWEHYMKTYDIDET